MSKAEESTTLDDPLLDREAENGSSEQQWKDTGEVLELPISTGCFMAKRTIMCWLVAFGFFNVRVRLLQCMQSMREKYAHDYVFDVRRCMRCG